VGAQDCESRHWEYLGGWVFDLWERYGSAETNDAKWTGFG
jgi:hypothetical protein